MKVPKADRYEYFLSVSNSMSRMAFTFSLKDNSHAYSFSTYVMKKKGFNKKHLLKPIWHLWDWNPTTPGCHVCCYPGSLHYQAISNHINEYNEQMFLSSELISIKQQHPSFDKWLKMQVYVKFVFCWSWGFPGTNEWTWWNGSRDGHAI